MSVGRKFDEMFANSPAATRTTTEKRFVEGFAMQISDIGAIMVAIPSVGVLAGAMPAVAAMRLRITEALRRA